jgi:hypothetical protein
MPTAPFGPGFNLYRFKQIFLAMYNALDTAALICAGIDKKAEF